MRRKDFFPRYPHKVRHASLVNPKEFVQQYLPGVRTPPRFLLLWNSKVAARLVRRFRGRRVVGLSDSHLFPRDAPAVGLSLPRGVGGPSAVILSEELAALGTKEFIGVGYAGSLSPDLRLGDVVLCDEAIRDEGTSHHYAHPSIRATSSIGLRRQIAQTLTAANIPFRTGLGWTTDAPYRETRVELRHYRRLGVLTVDMEAAALFIFARHRGVRAASVFVVSDVLTEVGWEPQFHRVAAKLERVAAAILMASLGGREFRRPLRKAVPQA
jgi:uridine phosphorylase